MFQGIFAALVTPLKDGAFDPESFRKLIEYQISRGIHGVVPCGTTGESATLTEAEHKAVIRSCVEIVDKRVKVLAGTGSNSTAESLAMTKYAHSVGVDGALLITPYYNKPTQDGLYAHFSRIAEAVDLPQVLYNVPGRTSVDMLPATVARLSQLPNVVGIKEATANMERASELIAQCEEGFTLISGDDATLLPFLAVGGTGTISVTANVATHLLVELWNAWQAGDVAKARELHYRLLPINQKLFCETNPIPIKAAAAQLGLCGEEIRLPLTPLSAGCAQELRGVMEELGLFSQV